MREEDVQKGSNYIIEVIVRALGRVLAERRRQGRQRPMHLWIQTDNASGENKNQVLARFPAVLVDRGIFDTVVHAFLGVGHTHEDIDALFGTLSGPGGGSGLRRGMDRRGGGDGRGGENQRFHDCSTRKHQCH